MKTELDTSSLFNTSPMSNDTEAANLTAQLDSLV